MQSEFIMKLFSSFQFNDQRAAIFFALISQSIWLPVFLTGHQDPELARKSKVSSFSGAYLAQQAQALNSPRSSLGNSPSGHGFSGSRQEGSRQSTGLVLHSALRNQSSQLPYRSRSLTTSDSANTASSLPIPSNFYSLLRRPASKSDPQNSLVINPELKQSGSNASVHSLYRRSELLGGTLTLQDINEPVMPAIARAERAQWTRSGDPLAPLPVLWREPMRRALTSLITITSDDSVKVKRITAEKDVLNLDSARFVHVPSTRIRRSTEVPLALQSDGTVDILNRPDDPAILEEITRWSTKQKLPEKGKFTAAVVHLHPLMPETSAPTAKTMTQTNPQPQPLAPTANRSKPAAPEPQSSSSPPASSQPLTMTSPAPVKAESSTSQGSAPAATAPAAIPTSAVYSDPVSQSHPAPPSEAGS
jgi:hypothetical protein